MTVALRVAGSWTELRSDNGVAIPATPEAGDRMFLFVAWKSYSITLTTPNGWTAIGAAFADGTVGAGNGTGSVKVMAFYRDWQSGDHDPFLDFSASPAEGGAVITVWSKAATELWTTPLTATAALSWGSGSTTTSASSSVAVPSGSVVLAMVAFRDDSATMTRPTTAIDDASAAITWNGDHVESPATHGNYTAGSDGSYDLGYRLVTTGATATLRVTGTLSASETGSAKWVVQGAFTATSVDAPLVSASVSIPPQPVGQGTFTGRLGFGRLGYLTLGRESVRDPHLADSAWVSLASMGETVASASVVRGASVGSTSGAQIDAPRVNAAAALPLVAVPRLTGRLGFGRLGYLTLGGERFASPRSAIASLTSLPAAMSASTAVASATVAGAAGVPAPLVTAASGVADGLSSTAGAPASAGATGAVSAASVFEHAPGELATAAGAVAAAAPAPGAFPSSATATGAPVAPLAVIGPAPLAVSTAAAAVDPGVTTSAGVAIGAPALAATTSTVAPLIHVAGAPAVATMAATVPAGVAGLGGAAGILAATSATYAPDIRLWAMPATAAASGAVLAGSVTSAPAVAVAAPSVSSTAAVAAGAVGGFSATPVAAETVAASGSVRAAVTWSVAVPASITATGSAPAASTASFPLVAVDAPTTTALAVVGFGSVYGWISYGGRGPDGAASSFVPQIAGAYPGPSGEASNVRPT